MEKKIDFFNEFENEIDAEEKEDELNIFADKLFKNSNKSFIRNTELFKLFNFDKYTKNREVLETLNKNIYNINFTHSNVFLTHLTAYQFFSYFRNTSDNISVTATLDKVFLALLQEEAEEEKNLFNKYVPLLHYKKSEDELSLREFLIAEKLIRNNRLKLTDLIVLNNFKDEEIEEYLNFFNLTDFKKDRITIFSSFNKINTNLKNLVIVKNNKEAISALKFKMLKDKKSLEEALKETNFVSINNNYNIYKKAEDIAFFADFVNAENILFAEKNIALMNNIADILKEIKSLKEEELPSFKNLNLGNRSFTQKIADLKEKELKNIKKESMYSTPKVKTNFKIN